MNNKTDEKTASECVDSYDWHANLARQLERAQDYAEASLHWKKASLAAPNETNLLWSVRRANFCYQTQRRIYFLGHRYV